MLISLLHMYGIAADSDLSGCFPLNSGFKKVVNAHLCLFARCFYILRVFIVTVDTRTLLTWVKGFPFYYQVGVKLSATFILPGVCGSVAEDMLFVVSVSYRLSHIDLV